VLGGNSLSIFATELKARPGIEKATFVAAVVAWMRGINRSTILDAYDAYEDYSDEIWLETASGESLSIKSFESRDATVFGARLEIPDSLGRKWRTECTLTDFGSSAYLRVRGQCVAINHSARVIAPKKPHFVRQSIEDGWCVSDGVIQPSSEPLFLNENDLDLAKAVVTGTATELLPILFVSRGNQDHLPLNVYDVAKRLEGVCHVVVEPSRAFSFGLMEATQRKNPYAGAIALFSPNGAECFRLFQRFGDTRGAALATHCVERTNNYVSSLASRKAWEWQDLQEAQSRMLREAVTTDSADQLEEYISAFDKDLAAKKEKIENLEARLALETARADGEVLVSEDLFPTALKRKIGPELYEGEFTDRLLAFLSKSQRELTGVKKTRTDEFVAKLCQELQFSGRSQTLISQIKSACRDGNEMPKQLGSILTGFGFSKSSAGKHVKFEPPADLFGLVTEVLPSTPSDSQRGGKNRGADVIRNFGLSELK